MAEAYKPLVSVITAFLNEERFLKEAVESVLGQTYDNWELILIDDGSSDKSTFFAKQYALDFPDKIIYCEHDRHTNKGLSASRNVGIKKAKGHLIAFLDADDVWLPEKLLQQVNLFALNPGIGMVAEGSEYWYSWMNERNDNIVIPVGAPPERVYQPAELLYYLYPLNSGAAPCPSGLILTINAISRVGGFEESFTKQYQLYEDQAFLNKIYLLEKTYISSACQNLYRQRHGSIVQQVHADGQYDQVRQYFLVWFRNYLHQQNETSAGVEKLIRQALFPYLHPGLHYLTNTLPQKLKNTVFKAFTNNGCL